MARPAPASDPVLFAHYHVMPLTTPVGRIWVESDGALITRLSFDPLPVRQAHPPKVLVEARRQLEAYFKGRRKQFDLPVLTTVGTRFQRLVWAELDRVPHGHTTTYQHIAQHIGGRAVARTVGQACAQNPLPIIVPCHRVIASNGLLTGYVGGLWRKRWLLIHEGALPNELF
jgi:O-6-methylguanine DNA methyltransferase